MSSSFYPTNWSEWKWSDLYNCYERYCEISPGTIGPKNIWIKVADSPTGQYSYDYTQQETATGSAYTPRNREADPPPLDTIRESYDVDSLTRNFGGTTLSPHFEQQQSYLGKGKGAGWQGLQGSQKGMFQL
jgi:hypothetical protein